MTDAPTLQILALPIVETEPRIVWTESPAWGNEPRNMGNKLHTICSYMAMFPPSIPHYFIERYSQPGDTVLDPYSGRGTAPLEACSMGRIGVGNDRSPLAFALTFAKTNTPQRGRVLNRIAALEKSFISNQWKLDGVEWQIRMIFHDSTLRQILHFQKELNWERSNVDAFVAAMLLGIIHGNSEGYLSLRMPNTFSMSPNYVKTYIEKHDLQRPNRDAFALLRRKLERCYQKPAKSGKTFQRDARKLGWVRTASVDLVVTSPPYTRVIRYGAYNWIRLWFLGENAKEVDSKLLCTQSLPKYLDFMVASLEEMKRVVKPGGHVVLIIGDVKDRVSGIDLNLAEQVWLQAARPLGFEIREALKDGFDQDTKVSRIWGEEKRGRATKVDRILVLKRPEDSTSILRQASCNGT